MYKIHQSRKGINLYKDGQLYTEFADWEDMASCLLAEIDFTEQLYGDPIWGDLALAKRAYPDLRMGQLIVNAMIEQRKQYVNCPDVFYLGDDKLIEGLRLLFTRRLVAHESLCKETNEKVD